MGRTDIYSGRTHYFRPNAEYTKPYSVEDQLLQGKLTKPGSVEDRQYSEMLAFAQKQAEAAHKASMFHWLKGADGSSYRPEFGACRHGSCGVFWEMLKRHEQEISGAPPADIWESHCKICEDLDEPELSRHQQSCMRHRTMLAQRKLAWLEATNPHVVQAMHYHRRGECSEREAMIIALEAVVRQNSSLMETQLRHVAASPTATTAAGGWVRVGPLLHHSGPKGQMTLCDTTAASVYVATTLENVTCPQCKKILQSVGIPTGGAVICDASGEEFPSAGPGMPVPQESLAPECVCDPKLLAIGSHAKGCAWKAWKESK